MSDLVEAFLRWSLGEREVSLMRNAPWAVGKIIFGITVIEVAAFWFLFSWGYGRQIEILKERVELQKEQSMGRERSALVGMATVSKDGKILARKSFDEYGLVVEKISFENDPAYQLTFEVEPEDFDVTTRENASREVVRVDSKQYRVRFLSERWGGSRPVECEFRIQAFSSNIK